MYVCEVKYQTRGIMELLCLVGIIEWEIQKLPPQGSGEQVQGEEVLGVLSMPKRRQVGESPK